MLKKGSRKVPAVTVLIPVYGGRDIGPTVRSIYAQKLDCCEVIILRNGKKEYSRFTQPDATRIDANFDIRQVYLPRSGKARALNIGIALAQYELVAVVDADCVLSKRALQTALRHFADKRVVAVGCKLRVRNASKSLLTWLQCVEYEKAFCISRSLNNALHCDFIISGAFGVFRKAALLSVGGYSEKTVGEDMEIILRLQRRAAHSRWYRIVYEKRAQAYTKVPATLKDLLRQRDRWQRGFVDSLLTHRYMPGNPKYGLLGTVVLPVRLLVDIIGPIAILCGALGLFKSFFPRFLVIGYLIFECSLTWLVDAMENGLGFRTLWYIPVAAVLTVIGIGYQILISVARVYGMLTFPWRKKVW